MQLGEHDEGVVAAAVRVIERQHQLSGEAAVRIVRGRERVSAQGCEARRHRRRAGVEAAAPDAGQRSAQQLLQIAQIPAEARLVTQLD